MPSELIFTGVVKFETMDDQILHIKSADINISEAVYKQIVKEFEQVILIIMDNCESHISDLILTSLDSFYE